MEEKVYLGENISLKKENNSCDIGTTCKTRIMVKIEPSEYLDSVCSEDTDVKEHWKNFMIKNEVDGGESDDEKPVNLSTNLMLDAKTDFEENESMSISYDTLDVKEHWGDLDVVKNEGDGSEFDNEKPVNLSRHLMLETKTDCEENESMAVSYNSLDVKEHWGDLDVVKNEGDGSEFDNEKPVNLSRHLMLETKTDCEENESMAVSYNTLEPTNADLVNVLRNIKIEKKLFNCYHCRYSSNGRSTFKRHVTLHMKSGGFQCPECGHPFSSTFKMQEHLRIHTGDKPFKCTICSFSTGYSTSFKYHMRSHFGEKPYACSLCDARFVSCTMLTRHKRVHTGERPFGCHLCDYKARAKGTLKSHLRTHTGEKPFPCSYCDKSFITSSSIRKHILVHLKNSERKCDLCEAIFSSKGEWREHLRTHHASGQCQHCGSETGSRLKLKRHLIENGVDASISCKFCDSCFKYKCAFLVHVVEHENKPFKCDKCEYKGPSVDSLRLHVRTKHILLPPRKLMILRQK